MLKKIVAFTGMLIGTFLVYMPSALAQAADAPDVEFTYKKFLAAAAAFAIGLGAFGGALAQGKAVAATMEGIARNPGAAGKMFVPMILGLALIESLVIYCLVIAFSLIGKLG